MKKAKIFGFFFLIKKPVFETNDKNIGNYEYIGNLILWLYRIYRRNINGYFGKNF